MKRDVHAVWTHVEQMRNLSHGEIGAVAERDELAIALLETGDGSAHLERGLDLVRKGAGSNRIRKLGEWDLGRPDEE